MPKDMDSSIFRRIQLATFAFLALVVLSLVVSAGLTVREQRRLANAEAQLERMHHFQRVLLLAARRLVLVGQPDNATVAAQADLLGYLDQLSALATNPDTPERLQRFRARVAAIPPTGQQLDFMQSFFGFQEMIETEQASQAELIGQLEEGAELQLRLELAAPLAILAVGVVLIPITRSRIIRPLHAFGRQLSLLARGVVTLAPVEDVDSLVLPLHRNFNTLVRRLQRYEAESKARTASLEDEVRRTTTALLEQQRTAAQAERLAATGELAASVAHELRNPLAGIQMTLANLREEIKDPDSVERIDLIVAEVGRLTRLLNGLVDAARHAPEPVRTIELADLVDDLCTLTRCQLPAVVHLQPDIDPTLTCRLPQDRLRQALLNLVLNAANALDGRGGTITITAAAEASRLRITIADDGPGFPAELLQNGIRPFFSTRERGTGLGLPMVRRFARDLGGDIVLSNRAPHGACVALELPLEAPTA
ncbi:MAG: sensor histidine kinase [Candidatus Binatia bacterium]